MTSGKRLRKDTCLNLALRGAEEILKQRTVTTMGIRFPADESTGYEGRYEYKLYDGAAGIGIVLLDLFCATGDTRYADLCEEISHGLIESTPESGPLPIGLYSGFSGVALFHLACARILQKREALDHAVELGVRLSQSPLVDTDIMRGAAGAGLLQLALFHATEDVMFLNGARRAAAFLADTSVNMDPGLAWMVRDPAQPLPKEDESYADLATHIHTGLAHGAAGICLFLLELADITKDPDVTQLADAGFCWLESKSLRLRTGLVWQRSEAHRVIQDHWCHGSAGIGHAYLARHRVTGDTEALEIAKAAGQATWDSLQGNRDELLCHCHGVSGAIDIFLELAMQGAGKVWQQRAYSLMSHIHSRAQKEYGETSTSEKASTLGGTGPGLGIGTAGIVRQLLRLSGFAVSPILIPCRDQLSLVPDSTQKARDHKNVRMNLPPGIDNSTMSELVPHVGIRFSSGHRFLAVGPPKPAATQEVWNMISNHTAAGAYYRALEQTNRACDRLGASYSHLIAKDALDPMTFGRLIREIAGMVLCEGADTRVVRRAARRMTENSIAALELMFKRLEADMGSCLSKEIGGRLTRVQIHGGDPHRKGQRVIALRFEDGPPLLYKARSVAIDREMAGTGAGGEPPTLADLCRSWLRPAIDGGLLPTHRIIAAGPWHGYAEQVAPSELSTFPPPEGIVGTEQSVEISYPEIARLKLGEDARYWYSAGLLAGHAFTLGIMDLHAENVICGKSRSTTELSLHAVDLEMAFGNVIDLEDTHLINGPRWGNGVLTHSHAPLDSPPSFTCGLYAEDWVMEIAHQGLRPVPRPWQAARWIFPHLVQNSDESFGYARRVCALLRGFADQWSMLQAHTREIEEHLRKTLQGVPMRVVSKPTRSYMAALSHRKLGGSPIAGAAVNPGLPVARPLFLAEMRQLNELDLPYFFRILGEGEESSPTIYWMTGRNVRYSTARNLPVISQVSPYWSVVEHQSDPKRLARAVVDIAWAVAPDGPFDFHDPALGVRVIRTLQDERLLVVVLLGENRDVRLTCRVASEGSIEWWLD